MKVKRSQLRENRRQLTAEEWRARNQHKTMRFGRGTMQTSSSDSATLRTVTPTRVKKKIKGRPASQPTSRSHRRGLYNKAWAGGGRTLWKRRVAIMDGSGGVVCCTYIWLWDCVLSLYCICLKQMETKLSHASQQTPL